METEKQIQKKLKAISASSTSSSAIKPPLANQPCITQVNTAVANMAGEKASRRQSARWRGGSNSGALWS